MLPIDRLIIFTWLWMTAKSQSDESITPICSSVKCTCDYSIRTVTCRNLVLEYMPSFPRWTETLNLNSNHLTLLKTSSFDGLSELRNLHMSFNGLEYMEANAFVGLSRLKFLDLSYNRLYYWPSETFSPLSELSILNLSGNVFDDLSVFTQLLPIGTNQLTELGLRNLKFTRKTADFVRLPPMKRLILAGSKFESVGGRSLILLASEEAKNQSIRVDALVQANELDLSGCNATLEPSFIDAIADAISLNIGSNRVRDLTIVSKFNDFRNLQSLNVSNLKSEKPISKWDVFPPSIKSLDISHIGVKEIDFTKLASRPNAKLSILFASGNQIHDFHLPRSLASIDDLRLASNRLINIPSVDHGDRFEYLTYLDVSDNLITQLDANALNAFPNLRIFLLSNNRIVHIHPTSFRNCSKLQRLDLSRNALEHVPIAIRSLRSLDISSNRLSQIDPGALMSSPNLERLDISYNIGLMHEKRLFNCSNRNEIDSDRKIPCPITIDWIDELSKLTNLKRFAARGVNLRVIPNQFRSILSRIIDLDMSDNLITTDQWESLASNVHGKPCLRKIRLRKNRLNTFKNLTLFKSDCTQILDLSENPFDCDCSLEPIYAILRSMREWEKWVYNDSIYYCYSQSNYNKYPFYEFASNLQPCSYFESNQSMASANGLRAILAIFLGLVAAVLMAVFCRACLGNVIKHGYHIRQRMYKPLRVIITGSGSDLSSPVML